MKEQRMGAAISPVWCERRIEGEPVNLVTRDLMKLVFQTRIFMLYAVSIWDVVQIFLPRGILWWKWGLQEFIQFSSLKFSYSLTPSPNSCLFVYSFFFLRDTVWLVLTSVCTVVSYQHPELSYSFLSSFSRSFNVSKSNFWLLHLEWKQNYKSLNKKIVW